MKLPLKRYVAVLLAALSVLFTLEATLHHFTLHRHEAVHISGCGHEHISGHTGKHSQSETDAPAVQQKESNCLLCSHFNLNQGFEVAFPPMAPAPDGNLISVEIRPVHFGLPIENQRYLRGPPMA